MMLLRSAPISAGATWAMTALTLWMCWPNTACLCADGHVKLFCFGQHGPPGDPSHGPTTTKSSCCDHPAVADRQANQGDCCSRPARASAELRGQGCRSLAGETPTVTSSATTKAPSDSVLAVNVSPLYELPASGIVTAQPTPVDTGPPVDLHITLQHLLI